MPGTDGSAQPLRDLNRVLEQVRDGQFNPDATRSGYFANPARASVEEQLELSSSSGGSGDEEDPEHEQFERAQNHFMQPFSGNFDDLKLVGITFFHHPVSRAIHVTSDESGLLFKCGREINRAYL